MTQILSVSSSRTHPEGRPRDSSGINWLKKLKALGCTILISGASGLGAAAQPTNSTTSWISSHTVQSLPASYSDFGSFKDMSLFEDPVFPAFFDSDSPMMIKEFQDQNQTAGLSNTIKIQAIQYYILFSKGSSHHLKFVIESLDPVFTDSNLLELLKNAEQNSFQIDPHVFESICNRYHPTNLHKTIRSLRKLEIWSHQDLLLKFISSQCRPILNSQKFYRSLPQNFDLDFYKNLHAIGLSSRWFNTPGWDGKTLIQKLIRDRDIQFLKILGQELSIDDVDLGDHFFTEEVRDCFRPSPGFSASEIEPGSMLAQNGCRMIVLEKSGRVRSIPGHEAKVIFQDLTGIKQDRPSFTVFLNNEHASIDFGNGFHVGFSPSEFPMNTKKIINKGASVTSKTLAGMHPIEKKLSLNFGDIGSASSFYSKLTHGYSVPCTVGDDSIERGISDDSNQLKLDFYATDSQVATIKEYAAKTKADCESGKESYALLRNCVDFVYRAIEATGTKADYRNAFSRMQLVRRPGLATLYATIRSRGPKRIDTDAPEGIVQTILENELLPEAIIGIGAVALYTIDSRIRKMIQIGLYALYLPVQGCLAIYNKARTTWAFRPVH